MNYKSVESEGATIYYHERGSGDPLVLIMGFGAEGKVWEKHAAVYEKHFRCIIVDNRGVGLSSQLPGPYSTKMMAADIVAVMDHAGADTARVAGISMGGAIAQELALSWPNRVKSMVLASTWTRFNNYTKQVYENLKHVRKNVPGKDFTELLQLWIYAPPYFDANMGQLAADVAAAGAHPLPQSRDGFEGQLDACIHHNTVERLNQIRQPVLITVGEMDIFTPPAFSELIHHHIPHSRLSYYPTGGHVHHWEDLERFNTETLEFLLHN